MMREAGKISTVRTSIAAAGITTLHAKRRAQKRMVAMMYSDGGIGPAARFKAA